MTQLAPDTEASRIVDMRVRVFWWAIPCFLGRSTVNLCSTSLVLPCSVPNRAPLPSITMKPNLLSSDSRAVNACAGDERVWLRDLALDLPLKQ